MTREEAKEFIAQSVKSDIDMALVADAIKALEQQTCEDAISRQAAIVALDGRMSNLENVDMQIAMGFAKGIIQDLPSPPVNPQPKTEQFAKWVATEIFDDMWEYNKDSFAEIACRKLAKMGIVRAKGDRWELVEPQESEVGE